MLKKICALLGSLLSLALADVWQNPVPASSADLGEALTVLSTPEIVRGSFTQTKTVMKIDRSFVSTGTFVMAKQEGIVWNIQKPFASRLMVSEKKMVQWNADGSRSEMSAGNNAVFGEISKTLRSVLSGDLSALESRFTIYFERSGKAWKIGLVPKEMQIRKIVASILLEGSARLKSVRIVDGEGNPLVYEFNKSEVAKSLSEEERKSFAE